MQSVTLRSHVGDDGILKLQIPVELKNVEVEVVVTLRTMEMKDIEAQAQANGWPPGFFEQTAGCWAGGPLVREPQGEYEVREEFL